MKLGNLLIAIGFLFSIVETIYFGSNWLPESTAEFICDAIALTLVVIGCTLNIKEIYDTRKYNRKERL